MPDDAQRFSLHRQIQSPPRAKREMLLVGGAYALEMTICIALLSAGYAVAEAKGLLWAMVTAVVVLQPGVHQSLVAAVQRIVANLIGASVGFGWGALLGSGLWQMTLSLIVVVAICQALRLEQSLRTACVSVIVVMSVGEGQVGATSLSRFAAVLIGSLTALVIQWLVDGLLQRAQSKPATSKSTDSE